MLDARFRADALDGGRWHIHGQERVADTDRILQFHSTSARRGRRQIIGHRLSQAARSQHRLPLASIGIV